MTSHVPAGVQRGGRRGDGTDGGISIGHDGSFLGQLHIFVSAEGEGAFGTCVAVDVSGDE